MMVNDVWVNVVSLFQVSGLRIISIYNLPRHCLFLFVTSSCLAGWHHVK